jgi:hypothetical protein
MERGIHMCCSYSGIGIIAMLKSVARIQGVKSEKPSVYVCVCVTVGSQVWRLSIAL